MESWKRAQLLKQMEAELMKRDVLMDMLQEVMPQIPDNPHFGHLGDMTHFNERLEEIIESFGGCGK